MILDTRQHLQRYLPKQVHDVIAAYLVRPDLATRSPGPEELGSGIRALLQEYPTRPRSEVRWEAHRAFWDLQLVLRGSERFGWAPIEDLGISQPFDAARDVVFLEGTGDFVTLSVGRFALLGPGDAHIPGMALDAPSTVRKVVFKIPTGMMG